jgi:hypothetical protein
MFPLAITVAGPVLTIETSAVAVAGTTVMLQLASAEVGMVSTTWPPKGKGQELGPAQVGVPVIAPVEGFRLKAGEPVGSDPEAIEYV